jgi:hypothetical protein
VTPQASSSVARPTERRVAAGHKIQPQLPLGASVRLHARTSTAAIPLRVSLLECPMWVLSLKLRGWPRHAGVIDSGVQ